MGRVSCSPPTPSTVWVRPLEEIDMLTEKIFHLKWLFSSWHLTKRPPTTAPLTASLWPGSSTTACGSHTCHRGCKGCSRGFNLKFKVARVPDLLFE